MRKREIIKKFKFLINITLYVSGFLPKGFHRFILKFTRNWDNYVAIFIRYVVLKKLCLRCGSNVAIFSGVYIKNPEKLELGDNVSIHPMCYIDATGGITINNDVSIAHATTIMSTEHNYEDPHINIKDQGGTEKSTIVDSNVWIGAGVRVLAGSKINTGCVVAAGAVVKNEIPANTIVGGVPAKIIKKRCE